MGSPFPGAPGSGAPSDISRPGPIATAVVPYIPGLPVKWSKGIDDAVSDFIEKSYGEWIFGHKGKLVQPPGLQPWPPTR